MRGKSSGEVSWLIDALFPRICVGCKEEGFLLCRACHAKWREHPRVDNVCFSFFPYADPVARGLLHAWKYSFDEAAWGILRKEIQERIPHAKTWLEGQEAELLIPVPLFFIKRNKRGFDQAEEIAQAIWAMTGISYAPAVLRRFPTKPQAHQSKSSRKTQYEQNPFAARKLVEGKRVIIVDDVYTTGATMDAVESALHAKGAVVVGRMALFEANE